ncbi:HD domain-containing protein [Candidatus Gottesmanbacteria bacterium]|nr:HD domain-containing protein [Candidatus Gottesmanbacteria bacterium]
MKKKTVAVKNKTLPIEKLLAFINQTEGLKRELRHSWLSNGRRESVAEHTWRMAIMALVLAPHLKKKPDMVTLLKMILIHDLPEVYAGDRAVWKKKQSNKHQNEKEALQRLIRALPSETKEEMMRLWVNFETCQTIESKMANALDKMEVLIQHNQAPIKTWNTTERTPKYSTEYGYEYCTFDEVVRQMRLLVKKQTARKLRMKA